MANFKPQNIYDFEKSIATARKEISTILGGERSNEHQAYRESATYVCGETQRNSEAAKSPEPVNRKERSAYDQQIKSLEETALRKWAKEEGVWIEEGEFNSSYNNLNYIDEGGEQRVYLKDSTSVVKINTGYFHSTWLEFSTGLHFMNIYFHLLPTLSQA